MADLGFLTPDQEQQFGQFFDELVDFTKFDGVVFNVVEWLDGKIFSAGITYLDDTLGEKIPDDFKPLVEAFVLAVIAKDEAEIVAKGTELLNKLIDIPKITEENEAIMIAGVLQGIVAVIMNFVNNGGLVEE